MSSIEQGRRRFAKLDHTLGSTEQQVLLIDDRLGELFQGYHKPTEDAPQLARKMRVLVISIAF